MSKPKKTMVQQHGRNFDTLREAFSSGHVVLLECQLKATGETVAVICAVNRRADGEFEFIPFAMMFNGNPYKILSPPNPEGGFPQ